MKTVLSILLLTLSFAAGADTPPAPATLDTSVTPGSAGMAILEIKIPFEATNHMLSISATEPTTRFASTHDVREGTTKQTLRLSAGAFSDWKVQVTGPSGTTTHVHVEYGDLKSDLEIKLP